MKAIGLNMSYRIQKENELGVDALNSPYGDFLKFLLKLGLSVEQSNIYLALMKHGSRKASEVAELLGLDRGRCYKLLTKLQSDGILEIVGTSPLRFDVAPIEKIISDKIRSQREYLSDVESQAPEVIHRFEKLFVSRLIDPERELTEKFKFSFVEGMDRAAESIRSVAAEAKVSIDFSADWTVAVPFQSRGIIDLMVQKSKDGVPIRAITNRNERIRGIVKDSLPFISIKTVNLTSIPNFIVADSQYVYILIEQENSDLLSESRKKIIGFTIYSQVFGRDMEMLFEYLWQKTPNTSQI